MRRLTAFALGVMTGAAAGYLLDPDRGRSRRSRLGDQTKSRARATSDSIRSGLEYQRGVAKGMVHDLTEPLRPRRVFDDETLLQKVRSEALGYWDHPDTIEIDIRDGMVRLTGNVESQEGRNRLIELIRAVDGVGLIDDRLDIAGSV
jgi:osmotically-inducible protein OsmY